ncbi:MAG: hypothetical protein R3F59_19005 [Myxococcota bacterium]
MQHPWQFLWSVLALTACTGDAPMGGPTHPDHQSTVQTGPPILPAYAPDELGVDPERPFNAVGFLSNGCTAFLIDADHIAAAAHCFVDPSGNWQPGLRFYPNFHPDRVVWDEAHVPRADVTRVVVGSRAGEPTLGIGRDWGIARVDNWRDVDGLDLTPLSLAPSVPPSGTPVANPAYNRHHCPYDDQDEETWNNTTWDTAYCNGQWTVEMQPAPLYDGVHRDQVWCNARWAAGWRHDDCSLLSNDGDVIGDDCFVAGGSSGAPVIADAGVIGLTHGGVTPDFGVPEPDCSMAVTGYGPSVDRFRDAPRFAANVAVHRRPDQPGATAVFAVDSDLDRVVMRSREGATPTWHDGFTYWTSLGSPASGLSRIAACSADDAGRPEVLVVGDGGLYTRAARPDASWGAWTSMDTPNGDPIVDLDTTTDTEGRCVVMALADGGAFTSGRLADGSWSPWRRIVSGSYRRITTLRYDDVVSVVLIDTNGAMWRTDDLSWPALTPLGAPGGVSAWNDVDATWDEQGRGFVPAVPEGEVTGCSSCRCTDPMPGPGSVRHCAVGTGRDDAPGRARDGVDHRLAVDGGSAGDHLARRLRHGRGRQRVLRGLHPGQRLGARLEVVLSRGHPVLIRLRRG